MHKLKYIWIILISFSVYQETIGQLSPGPLAEAHAHLEGISNCLKCHVVGSKVSDKKCLDCHDHLKNRLDNGQGYHNSAEVKKKSCAECHSDHHGLTFEMIRFDENKFDHELTGYKLIGAHQTVDCRDCHKADYIKNTEIKEIQNTFLGLGDDCLSCHDDYHQNTLDQDCLSCHNMKEFDSAPKFDHEKTNFTLRGAHKNTDCADCHDVFEKNDREFQNFSNVAHNNCSDCHQDVHKNTLGNQCVSCHSESSFKVLNKRFNHAKTGFILEGKHKGLDCKKCHQKTNELTRLFGEYQDIPQNDCVSCHEDIHLGKFGEDCLECHTVQSFRYKIDMESFDHRLTSFPLEGAHVTVDCKSCHEESLTNPVPHSECRSCHDNFHENSFNDPFLTMDCDNCHSVYDFSTSSFDLEAHDQTNFPLKGAHQATPCIFCHQKSENWIL